MAVEKVKHSKTENDLPTTNGAVASRDNALITALAGPTDMVELKAALMRHGGKIKHVGGALPPLFPEKGVREGDARLVSYLGFEIVPEERSGGGGGAFVVLNFDVIDHSKATLPVAYRAQMIFNTTLETYFQAQAVGETKNKQWLEAAGDEDLKIPARDAEKTPLLLITFAGSMQSKKQGFAGAKRWIIEEFTPAKA